MEKFQFNRFLNVLKWYLQVNRNPLLAWTVGVFLCVFVGECFMLWAMAKTDHQAWLLQYSNLVSGITGFWLGATLILVLYIQTTLFNKISNKRIGTIFLTLPASNAEKFTVLFIYVLLISPLCLLSAFVLGDMLRMVVIPLFSQVGMVSSLREVVSGIFIFPPQDTLPTRLTECLLLFSAVVWLHSMYLLAGAALRKNAFSFVSTALLLAVCLLGYLISSNIDKLRTWDNISQLFKVFIWLCILGGLLWAACNYWLSYRIFKNYQLINNKTTNL